MKLTNFSTTDYSKAWACAETHAKELLDHGVAPLFYSFSKSDFAAVEKRVGRSLRRCEQWDYVSLVRIASHRLCPNQ